MTNQIYSLSFWNMFVEIQTNLTKTWKQISFDTFWLKHIFILVLFPELYSQFNTFWLNIFLSWCFLSRVSEAKDVISIKVPAKGKYDYIKNNHSERWCEHDYMWIEIKSWLKFRTTQVFGQSLIQKKSQRESSSIKNPLRNWTMHDLFIVVSCARICHQDHQQSA